MGIVGGGNNNSMANIMISFKIFSATLLLSLASCASNIPTSTTLQKDTAKIPEEELLNVGVTVFTPLALEVVFEKNGEQEEILFENLRRSESYYTSTQMMKTIQQSNSFGTVRIIPANLQSVDLNVSGKILKSDGEILSLEVEVSDSSNHIWFTRKYSQSIDEPDYGDTFIAGKEPFQGIYNAIVNDIVSYKNSLDSNNILKLRMLSKINFGAEFSPEVFNSYMIENLNGVKDLIRFPAENDIIFEEIQNIDQQHSLYLEMLQSQYNSFEFEIEELYFYLRKRSMELRREVKESLSLATNQESNNNSKKGTNTSVYYRPNPSAKVRLTRQILQDALIESGKSYDVAFEPVVIQLEDNVVTLTGNVDKQYLQLKDILREMYLLDRGLVE